jgi:hypothetical protein
MSIKQISNNASAVFRRDFALASPPLYSGGTGGIIPYDAFVGTDILGYRPNRAETAGIFPYLKNDLGLLAVSYV